MTPRRRPPFSVRQYEKKEREIDKNYKENRCRPTLNGQALPGGAYLCNVKGKKGAKILDTPYYCITC